jgi:uncharacterized protein YndB with AHSA1/START domain
MTTASKIVVQVSHRFAASPERVFDAWLDVDKARRFLFATENGTIVRAEIDARVGGRFTIVDRRDTEEVLHTGEYLEIDRPRRLVFTFGIPQWVPDFDLVTIEIAPSGSGCELTLTHEMDAKWVEWTGRVETGWTKMLGMAAQLLE